MVKVKVCGITNLDDALKALEFGADALGFNFYPPSPRSIAPERARALLRELPPEGFYVALFVNEPKAKVRAVLSRCSLPGGGRPFSGLQFHGEESQDYCRGWELKVIKAFRIKDRESLAAVSRFPADFYLLDSWTEGYGGSGSSFPWSWLEGIEAEKIFLAGGLSCENVTEAIRHVRPYAVDVCTGVEARPGIKDHAKLKEFIRTAKAA